MKLVDLKWLMALVPISMLSGCSSASDSSQATGGGARPAGVSGMGGAQASGGALGSGAGAAGAEAIGGVPGTGGLGVESSFGGATSIAGTLGIGGDAAGAGGTSSGGTSGAAGSSGGGSPLASAGSSAGDADGTLSGPPMGWASWNAFGAQINYNVIKGQADALVSSGLKTAGYEFVNIDEGWWQGTRDSSGNITVAASDWPGGMQAISDYIHGLGLKAGIYTDAGKAGCGFYSPINRPAAPNSGSAGHYDQDFLQFSKWGFDFVKVDWCGGVSEGLNAKNAYQAISDSIKRGTAQTGRSMTFSVCNWGLQNTWDWAPTFSTMWRTSEDIIDFGTSASMARVLRNFDSALHPTAQSPGHYNDPDMMIVGMPGFSAAQNRTHMAMWAIAGAPLLAGNQLSTMSAETKSILTNAEVIAIDQDRLAKQGVKVSDTGGLQVYSRVLSGTNRRAVLLLNRSKATGMITMNLADIGLGSTAMVRDVWAASDLGSKTTSYAASVPASGSVLLLVTGQ